MTNQNPFITIPAVAKLMREAGESGGEIARERRVYRSLKGPAFPSAYQSGEGTSAFLIKTEEAEAWIALGCPTPTEYYKRDGDQEQQADDAAKQAWHLEECRLGDVAGLDR